ncbi:unnamed protein product [Linum tenue]|uniref:Uncharacterized protein n=1 Tax=Linum tenue TaxID=586396 RepID=A0AAV0NX14_9ROSI|nr:unnamed protein product [Linum tenue]
MVLVNLTRIYSFLIFNSGKRDSNLGFLFGFDVLVVEGRRWEEEVSRISAGKALSAMV